ncbi:MAG TPA: aquaporin [Pyrinomonadaceae bacterium]|nr:aquaporin [Pyrinomonadaceae bacterium]
MKHHCPEYLMEAVGLAGFVVGAGLLTTLLEHPDALLHQSIGQLPPLLRRVPLGLVMGAYIAGIIYSPWGKRSGAHINPSVTWAFYSLGKIKLRDALLYTLAQFTGAICAAQLLKVTLGRWYSHPSVNYTATMPGREVIGTELAFAAEFVISFLMMLVMLIAINSERLEKLAGLFAGLLIGIYLIVEAPFSGMSMNPARTFGSALAARQWSDWWVYFTAPPLAMLLAGAVYRRLRRGQLKGCAKLYHSKNQPCIFCEHKESPHYPVEESATA